MFCDVSAAIPLEYREHACWVGRTQTSEFLIPTRKFYELTELAVKSSVNTRSTFAVRIPVPILLREVIAYAASHWHWLKIRYEFLKLSAHFPAYFATLLAS